MARRVIPARVLWVMPGLTAAVVGMTLQSTSSWRLVRIPWLDPDRSFEDLWQVTSNADCVATDPHWSPANSTCDPLGRPYNYPVVWAKAFAHLGLRSSDTQWLGTAMILIYGVTLIALAHLTLRRAPVAAVAALTVSAVSPPAMVAMERGNVDLLVWPWVILGLWLMSHGRWAAAVPVLVTAVYLKIFPLGAFAAVLARRRNRRLFLLGASVACLVALAIEADQLALVRRSTPQIPVYSWGVSVLPLAAGSDAHQPSPYLTGLAFFVLCLAVGLLALRLSGDGSASALLDRVRDTVSSDPVSAVVVNAGLGLVLVTYLLGANFDYRMVVLTVLAAGLARCWTDLACRIIALALIALQFISYPLGYPRELVGDLVWAAIAPGLAVLACWLWVPAIRGWVRSEEREAQLGRAADSRSPSDGAASDRTKGTGSGQ